MRQKARQGDTTTRSRPIVDWDIWRWASEHRVLFVVLAACAALSYPGWWGFNGMAQSVASNVFASILVIPVLVFGVERALNRVERRRNWPRALAMRRALDLPVIRMLHAGLEGSSGLKGLDNATGQAIRAARTPEAIAESLTDATADFVLNNQDAVRDFIAKRPWAITDKAIRLMLRESKALREMLWLAQNAVAPETFADAFEMYDRAIELDMARFMTSDDAEYINKDFISEVRAATCQRLADVVVTLARLHQQLPASD